MPACQVRQCIQVFVHACVCQCMQVSVHACVCQCMQVTVHACVCQCMKCLCMHGFVSKSVSACTVPPLCMPHVFVSVCKCLSVCASICACMCLSVCASVSLSMHVFISVCMFLCMRLCQYATVCDACMWSGVGGSSWGVGGLEDGFRCRMRHRLTGAGSRQS